MFDEFLFYLQYFQSVPSYHNFKDVVCGEEHITKFQIYNFGTSTLNFALKCYKHFGSAEEDPFVINPTRGCLKPEDHLEITVKLCSYENCLGTYCIRYHLLMSESSNELLEDFSEYKTNALLFKMDYYMYYPTLRVRLSIILFIYKTKNSFFPKWKEIIYFCKLININKSCRYGALEVHFRFFLFICFLRH